MRRKNILSMVTIFSVTLIPVLTFLGLSGNPAFAEDTTPPTVVDITGDTTGTTGETVTLTAVVEDDVGVTKAIFHIGEVSAAKVDNIQDIYTTTVPLPGNSTDDIPYYFEASDAAGNTVRSPKEVGAYYTITVVDNDPPMVEVIQPNGGETLGAGRRYNILWTAEDNIGVTSIDLLYSIDNGSSWEQISTGEDNDGVYKWKVTNTLSTECLMKVIAYDAESNSAGDVSDDVFTIERFEIHYPFFDDMEDTASGNWDFDPPWDYTTEVSRSGNVSITDSPDGDYANNVSISATLSARIDLSGAVTPVLTFWHRYSLETNADFGYVDISTDSGNTWSTIYFVTGHHTEWKEEKIDLTPYSGSINVMIRFRLMTNESITFDGWYIDDVSIDETKATISYPFFDDMESGTDNWLTSSWELVTPGHSPIYGLTDSSEGNTPSYINTSLTLANTIDLSSAKNPQLTFWHHYYMYRGYVEVSTDRGRTYTTLREYEYEQANWVQEQVDLRDYVELPTVRIRFRVYTSDSSYDGWYIDDVRIEDTPDPHPELSLSNPTMHGAHLSWEQYQPSSFPSINFVDFARYEIYRDTTEDVNHYSGELVATIDDAATTEYDDVYSILEPNYYYYRMYVVDVSGMYSVGSNVVKAIYTIPTVGYPFFDDMESGTDNWEWGSPWGLTEEKAHSGSYSWSDSPNGSYANNANTALTTSVDISSAVMPVLTFWHRYSFETNADFGYVDISTDLGQTWSAIYFVTGHHTEWKEEKIDLTSYPSSADFRIRFRLMTNGSNTYDGWYIDDISIDETKATISYPFFDDMESGTDNWLTSSWELATPGHSLNYCLTDSPEGNTPTSIRTSLTLANTIDLSSAKNPQLTFWHHYHFGSYPLGYVEVSTDKGRTYTKLKEYSGQQADWVQEPIDLKDYVGLSTVRIRFRVYTSDSSYDGWYIDDVRIDEDLSAMIDWCNLDSPASASTLVGVPTENIYGLVYEDGITEPEGQGEGIIAQLGYGPDGSLPWEAGWNWVDAVYDSDVDDKDKYVATLTVGAEGTYDYCYRYQLEGTGVWTYGDLDGNDLGSGGTNGYSPEQAGNLTVVSLCSFTVISKEPVVLENLHQFRDNLLTKNEAGQKLIQLYYQHSPEVALILFKHHTLSIRSAAILKDVMPGIHFLLGDEKGRDMVMTPFRVARIKNLFEDISKEGSEELVQILSMLSDLLEEYKGMWVSQIWQAIDKNQPEEFALFQNHPNPFNPDTWIPYQLSESSYVWIRIYNVSGQLVRTLHLGAKPAGFYLTKAKAAYWDGKNESGEQVASGVYFYQLQAGDVIATRKMLMVK